MIRRTLAEIRARARKELRTNETITVYTFVGGIEQRRAANPMAAVHAQWRRVGDSFAQAAKQAAESFKRMGDEFIKAARQSR